MTGLIELVVAARNGEPAAWPEMVDRFMPLVRSIVRAHRLTCHDAEDVHQLVWMRLYERIHTLASPEVLPRWLITVTRNECINVIRSKKRCSPAPEETIVFQLPWAEDLASGVLRSESVQAVLEGYALLPAQHRALLQLLLLDPPLSYNEIAATMGMPVGSIGPTRARALAKLRATPSVRALLDDTESA